MQYNDAIKYGRVEGIIKCTYVMLYADAEGKQPLFSLQRKHIDSGAHDYMIFDPAMGKAADLNISVDLFDQYREAVTAKQGRDLIYDAAYTVVVAAGDAKGGMVPVILNDAAIYVIDNVFALRSDADEYSAEGKYADLYLAITEGKPLYVKAAALDWYPVDADAKDEVIEAEAAYEQSKRVMTWGGLLGLLLMFNN